MKAESLGQGQANSEIEEVLVPTREAVEIRNGKRVTVTRTLIPRLCIGEHVFK